MIRKYDNHKPQTTPRRREEEPLNHHETPGRQIKQKYKPKLHKNLQTFHKCMCMQGTLQQSK